MSQIIVHTIRLNIPLYMYIENNVTGFIYMALKVVLVLCGIWSLDFFLCCYSTILCKQQHQDCSCTCTWVSSGIYPIFLILLTYVCIKLHNSNFRPVVWLRKPFRRHFVHLRRRWDSTASMTNAFTTFLLLFFLQNLICILHTILYLPCSCYICCSS